jgi:site-specific DNA-cytosine methylase
MAKKKLTALGGDIFAGLFTYGVRRAGFEILGHLEHTTYGTPTCRLNYPDLEIRNGVHTWRPEEFTGRVNFMYTNPPCAAWSAMQLSKPWQEHEERLQIVRDLTTAGLIVQPDVWCWESVVGAWRKGREFVMGEVERWLSYGYHVTVLLQNNMYLGANQNRPRMFLIAHKYPLVWPSFVDPLTVGELLKSIPKKLGKPPVKEPPLAESLQKLWAECPATGHTLRRTLILKTAKEQEKLRPRPAMTVRRLKLDEVPLTFIGASKRLHPRSPRTLNWYECLAMAGLPLDWKTAHGSLEPASLELSRAVMPAVGEWLATAVRDGLRKKPLPTDRVVATLVDLRKPDDPVYETLTAQKPMRIPPPPRWEYIAPPEKERPIRAPRTGSGAPRGQGIGVRMRELISQGLSTQDILTTIHEEFPTSKATASDVSWNRAKLRQLRGEK